MNIPYSNALDFDSLGKPVRNINNRLALALVLTALTAISVYAAGNYTLQSMRKDLSLQYDSVLISEAHAQRNALKTYLVSATQNVELLADPIVSQKLFNDFNKSFNELGNGATEQLQTSYITNNPNPIGNKQALLAAPEKSSYNSAHSTYHAWLRDFALQNKFYDLFLIGVNGDVLYTVYKEEDFATNLVHGPYSDTAIGGLFRTMRDNFASNDLFLTDFAPYEPSNFQMAAFIGAPVILNGNMIGAVMAQLKSEKVASELESTVGFGSGNAAHLIGEDHLLRVSTDNTRSDGRSTVRILTESADLALHNLSGVIETTNHRGVNVLSAHVPLSVNNVNWALLVEQPTEAVFAPYATAQRKLLLATLVAAIAAFAIGWALADNDRSTEPFLTR